MIINTNNEEWKFDTVENHFYMDVINAAQIWVSPQTITELIGWYSKYQREVLNEKVNSSSGATT